MILMDLSFAAFLDLNEWAQEYIGLRDGCGSSGVGNLEPKAFASLGFADF